MSILTTPAPQRAGSTGPPPTLAHHTMWQRLSPAGAKVATLSWRAVGAALLALSGWDVTGMAVFGDRVFSSPSYDLARQIPGGMRTYAIALAGLLLYVVYGYGQHRVGNGRRLRLGLSLLAGWHLGWFAVLAATYVLTWQVPSWRALGVGAFTAFIAVLVARSTPPDRG